MNCKEYQKKGERLGREYLVQHEENHNPGDRDVEPDGERLAGDRFVTGEVALERAVERDQDERHDHNRQKCVR